MLDTGCGIRLDPSGAPSLGAHSPTRVAVSALDRQTKQSLVWPMAKGDYLGEFEHLVLLAITCAGGEAGGATIHDELERASKRGASLPAIYVTLGRLEKKGFIRSRETPTPSDRGGRPRRLFTVTRTGAAALRETRDVLERMWGSSSAPARSR